MRITYERFLELFPNLSKEEQEKFRLLFERLKKEEINPPEKKGFSFNWAGGLSHLKDRYTSVELQKEALHLWSGI